eukprot:219444-Pleurochrysis_carterae.AAC.1
MTSEARALSYMQVAKLEGLSVAHRLAWSRTVNEGSIWPSSLSAKRRGGALASAPAITVRSDAEAA